jgi:hypothetical protein
MQLALSLVTTGSQNHEVLFSVANMMLLIRYTVALLHTGAYATRTAIFYPLSLHGTCCRTDYVLSSHVSVKVML